MTEISVAAGDVQEPEPFRFVPREEGPAARWLRAERARTA